MLAAASLAGADLALSALALAQLKPAAGRGVREVLTLKEGTATLIDESYNANPASMKAAITVLGQAGVGPRGAAHRGARRHAGTRPRRSRPASRAGRGGHGQQHRHGVLLWSLMRNLWEALPSAKKGGYADNSAAIEPQVIAAIGAGDAVMVKGSLGSRMKVIVSALQKRFPGQAALDDMTE